MINSNLENKIAHARSHSELDYELNISITQLLKRGIGNNNPFLTYLDTNGNRVENYNLWR